MSFQITTSNFITIFCSLEMIENLRFILFLRKYNQHFIDLIGVLNSKVICNQKSFELNTLSLSADMSLCGEIIKKQFLLELREEIKS